MSHPLYVITIDSQDCELIVKLNDVRQYLKTDAEYASFSAKLNPWLVEGANRLEVLGRPVTKVASGSAASQESKPRLEIKIFKGRQGLPLSQAQLLLEKSIEKKQLLASPGGAWSAMVSDSLLISSLEWQPLWIKIPPNEVSLEESVEFIQRYRALIEAKDGGALIEAHRPRIENQSLALGLPKGRLEASLLSMLDELSSKPWTVAPTQQLRSQKEGEGRLTRTEGSNGGPALRRGRPESFSGLSFLLSKGAGRIWIMG
jgi:hypothetical protein